jgi:hypothetical protein
VKTWVQSLVHPTKKKKQVINVREDMEKLDPSYIGGGNVKWCSKLWKIVWQFL